MNKNILLGLTLPRKPTFGFFISHLAVTDFRSKFLHKAFFHLSNIQYIAILLWIQMHLSPTTGKEALCFYIQRISGIITMNYFIEQDFETWIYSSLLIFVWVYLAILLITFIYCLSKASHSSQNQSLPDQTFTHTIFQLHFHIMFYLSNIILMAPWSSRNQSLSINLNIQAEGIFSIFSLVLVIFNCLIGEVLASFCFSPFEGINTLSTRNSSFQLLIFNSKALFSLILPFLLRNDKEIHIIIVAFAFMFCVWLLALLHETIPYYNHLAIKTSVICYSVGTSISLANIVELFYFQNSEKGDVSTITYLTLVLIPIIVKIALSKLNSEINYYMQAKISRISSEKQAFKKLFAFSMIRDNLRLALHDNIDFNLFEAYFLGELVDHSTTCQQEDCFCNLYLHEEAHLIKTKLKESLKEFIQQRIIEFMIKAIEKIKDHNELKIALANLLLNYGSDKITMALTHLFSISDKTSNLSVRIKREILLQRTQRRLDKNFLDHSHGNLNVKRFVEFYTLKVGFIEVLVSNTRKYIDFWTYYKQPNFQMLKCLEKSNMIENEADQIDLRWNSGIKKFPKFYSQMKDIYCMYLTYVRNTPSEAYKMTNKFFWDYEGQGTTSQVSNKITQENIIRLDTVLISINMGKEKPGRIQYISENSETIFGHKQLDLLGKNVNILMPPVLGVYHDELLHNHIQHGMLPGGSIGHKITSGYVKNKKGYIQPCSLYLSIFPYIQNDVNYMGILRLNHAEDEFMILTGDGFIEGFSKNLGYTLNLYETKSTFITDVCMNIVVSSALSSPKLVKEKLKALSDPNKKKKTIDQKLFRNVFDLSEVDTASEQNHGEATWKNLFFLKQSNSDALENSYIRFDAHVKVKNIMNFKFYLMTLKNKSYQEQQRGNNKVRKSIADLIPESCIDIQNELASTEKDLMNPHIVTSPNSPALKTPSLIFTKFDLATPTVVPVLESVISPKRMVTDLSQLHQETEHGLLKKQEAVQSREITLERRVTIKHINKKTNSKMKAKIRAKQSDRASVSVAGSRNWQSQLEDSICKIPKNPLTKYINIIIKVTGVLSICVLIIFLLNTSECLSLLKNNVKILTISSLRIFRLIQNKRGMEGIMLLKSGLYDDLRFKNYNLPPFRTILSSTIAPANAVFSELNGKLRFFLNQTETSLFREFYNQLVPITINDSGLQVTYMNMFDAATEIVTRVDKISVSIPNVLLKQQDEDLEFVRRNVLNELLMTSEQINETIVTDTHIKFQNLINLALGIMVFMVALGFMLMGLFIWQKFKFTTGRDRFIDLFLRIGEQQITPTLHQVLRFEASLVQFHSKCSTFSPLDNDRVKSNQEEAKANLGQGSEIRRKNADMKGINLKPMRAGVLTLFLFVTFLVPFIHVFSWISTKDHLLRTRFNTIVEVNTAMYELILMPVSFYEYIINKGTTKLRNKPIAEEWEAIFHKRSQAQGFFLDLLIQYEENGDECDPSVMKTLRELINGDLCEVLPKEKIQAACPLLASGLLRKGIQSVNSFYLYTVRFLKDEYDASNKTFEAAKAVLNHQELKDLELFLARWQYSAYEMLGNVFDACTTQIIEKLEANLIVYMIIYLSVYLIGASLITYLLVRFIEEDRVSWRKMPRKIPLEVILANKTMKSYLTNSKWTNS